MKKTVVVVGAGIMAVEYTKVLRSLGIIPVVFGRGELSTASFESKTGIMVETERLANWLTTVKVLPDYAIVAVDVSQLASVTKILLKYRVKKILVEKPGGLNQSEVESVLKLSLKNKANVYIAYNRRFYFSVIEAQKIINSDGGVLSFHFDFTEFSWKIPSLNHPKSVLQHWFFNNSTHVVDLAFFLCGLPQSIESQVSKGRLDWHKKGDMFTGFGKTVKGAHFTYNSNWIGPGRWGIEIITKNHKLVLRPLEELNVQRHGELSLRRVKANGYDATYKPGIFLQTKSFLQSRAGDDLLPIKNHYQNIVNVYQKILKSTV